MAKLSVGRGYYTVGSPSKHEVYQTNEPKHQSKTNASTTEETSLCSLSSSAPIPISPIGISTHLGINPMQDTEYPEEPAQPLANSSNDKIESNVFCIFPFDDEPSKETTSDTSSIELLGREESDSTT